MTFTAEQIQKGAETKKLLHQLRSEGKLPPRVGKPESSHRVPYAAMDAIADWLDSISVDAL